MLSVQNVIEKKSLLLIYRSINDTSNIRRSKKEGTKKDCWVK